MAGVAVKKDGKVRTVFNTHESGGKGGLNKFWKLGKTDNDSTGKLRDEQTQQVAKFMDDFNQRATESHNKPIAEIFVGDVNRDMGPEHKQEGRGKGAETKKTMIGKTETPRLPENNEILFSINPKKTENNVRFSYKDPDSGEYREVTATTTPEKCPTTTDLLKSNAGLSKTKYASKRLHSNLIDEKVIAELWPLFNEAVTKRVKHTHQNKFINRYKPEKKEHEKTEPVFRPTNWTPIRNETIYSKKGINAQKQSQPAPKGNQSGTDTTKKLLIKLRHDNVNDLNDTEYNNPLTHTNGKILDLAVGRSTEPLQTKNYQTTIVPTLVKYTPWDNNKINALSDHYGVLIEEVEEDTSAFTTGPSSKLQ